MKFIKEDNEFIVIDFENKFIGGRTTKKNFHNQIEKIKEMVGNE